MTADSLSIATQLVLLIAATAAVVAVGVYIVGRVRAGLREDDAPSSELLSNFRELHARGELSDEEYRTIKAMLSARLQEEIKDSGEEV